MSYKEPPHEHRWKKGQSGNINGRPKGAISVISRLKREFRENPEKFNEFMSRYVNNPQNEKHIAEMIDGKPFARGEMKVDLPNTLIDLIRGTTEPNRDTELSDEDSE